MRDQTRFGGDTGQQTDARNGVGGCGAPVGRPRIRRFPLAAFAAALVAFGAIGAVAAGEPAEGTSQATELTAGCTRQERDEVLRSMQTEVLQAVPTELVSFADALESGGPLQGWGLSHGYVVLDTAGAVATDNLRAVPPVPPLLLYEPSSKSRPTNWLDFDGPDDPYRLVGWAYVAPYIFGSEPPQRRCIAPSEWFVHEAGWHLKDGGMYLTPGATAEPPRPTGLAIHMWHPRVWDLHLWRGEQGVPTVSFANPRERRGGKVLPKEAFFRFLSGKTSPPWGRDR